MTARMGEMPVCAPSGLPIRGQPRDYEYGFASCPSPTDSPLSNPR